MAKIVLRGIAVRTPAVGFGCSSLTGTGPSNANRFLETAFDAGVRHFDTTGITVMGKVKGFWEDS
jgi:aryl-alcohol dehydrogenase-like predicted oxidoreductase